MTTRTQRYSNRQPKQDKVINLIDTGGHNTTPVIRELELNVNPVTGTQTYHTPGTRRRNPTDPNDINDDDTSIPFIMATEDKGQTPEPYTPQDPEPGADEMLEAQGATIIDSTTYFPASKQSLSKRSMTPEEHAAERTGYYLER